MDNLLRYNNAFCEALSIEDDQLSDELALGSIPSWDSVGQMMLVACIENAFEITLEPDDIIAFSSYAAGKKILHDHYQIEL